jgi:acetoin utilization deacetylase AcuC-like enzyme|tara:strand:- start:385 stop:1413 length:1029 start_codon:yes stop_codon:yes gene_type:complete
MKTVYTKNHILRNSKTELFGGELVKPFERPERMEYILNEIKTRKLGAILDPVNFDMDIIYKIHDKKYVDFLNNAWNEWVALGFKGEAIPTVYPSRSMNSDVVPTFIEGKLGYYCLANETSISEGTVEAAYESVKVALTAADMLDEEKSVFALCRPPGHHASKDQYGGYCFFNNVAIAAEKLKEKGAKRIFILDIDFHHGNGTQAIFYDRSDVFFVSLHGDPKDAFPHFLGHADEKGSGEGVGYNCNYPMPPGTPYDVWTKSLDDSISKIQNFSPDALIVSLGVDTYENDPISFFKLKSDDFFDVGRKIASINLPTLFVMEGGYAIKEIGVNTVNTLKGFENE